MLRTNYSSESIPPKVDEHVTKNNTSGSNVYKWDIVWINVFILGTLHLLTFYAYFMRYRGGYFQIQTMIFIKMVSLCSALGTTAGAHRLWAHRGYKASMPLQIMLAAFMTLSYQNSIYIWCRDHRLHHKYSETDADPHNSKRGLFFSHVGWLLVKKHKDVIAKGKHTDMTDLAANPVIMFQHKYYYYLVMSWGFLMPTLVSWYFFNESLWYAYLATTASYITSVNAIWCVNSISHHLGNRPYNSKIGPAENKITQYIGMGEGFHNYHHTFPWDYKVSEYGFEGRNWAAGFIDLCAKIGWVTDRRMATKQMVDQTKLKGDGTPTNAPNNLKSMTLIAVVIFLTF